MKNKLLLPLAAVLLALAGNTGYSTTIAQWTFENLTISAGSTYTNWSNGKSITNVTAEIGSGTISGFHSGFGSSSWGTASGNGSSKSLTGNGWTNNPGDYFQAVVSTVGYTNITIAWDQIGSSTGPKNWKLLYSTDGVSFTQFSTYTNSGTSWSAAAAVTGSSYSVDLSTVTALANQSVVYIRLAVVDNGAINGTGLVGTSGTTRVDNFTVQGTIVGPPKIVSQPSPATVYFGDTVSFVVLAGGDAPLTYQWYTNSTPPTALTDGGNVTGTTSNILTFSFVSTNQAGNYLCIVSNALNTVTSSVAQLTVNVRTPIVTNIAYIRKLHDTNFALTDTTNIYVVEGIVTTPINLVSGTTEVESYYIQDTNGNGCDVFFRGGFYFGNPGDKVRITAPLLQFSGALELAPVNGNPAHKIELLSSGNPVPAPQFFDFTTLPSPTNMEEQLEGRYMIVSNIFIGVSTNAAGHFTAGGSVSLTNGVAARFFATVPNNPAVDIVGNGLGGTFAKAIRGVMYQNQTSGTVLTNFYSILLAQGADIEYGTPVTCNPDAFAAYTGTTNTFQPLTNDTVLSPLVTPRVLTVTAVGTPSPAGSASITNGTNVVFAADASYTGPVTISYTATDDAGYSATGTMTVTVSAAAVPPTPEPIVPQVQSGKLIMSWTQGSFYLASSTNVLGPYVKIPGATSPYTNNTGSGTLFFRLVNP